MNSNQPIALVLIAAAAAACSGDTSELVASAPDATVGPADAQVPDLGPPDLGPPDLGPPDSGEPPDLGPDAGRVDRTLTELRPLGTLPVDNLVLSPMMDTFSSVGPVGFDGLLPRLMLRQSPTQTPAVGISNDNGLFMLTQTHGARLLAELWIGVPEGGPTNGISVGLIALTETGIEGQIPMEPDGEPPRLLDGIDWYRFAASIEERLYGTAALLVQNQSSQTVLATGPVVVAQTSSLVSDGRPVRTAPVVRSRPVSAEWRPLADFIAEWSKKLVEENLRRPAFERGRRLDGRKISPPPIRLDKR